MCDAQPLDDEGKSDVRSFDKFGTNASCVEAEDCGDRVETLMRLNW